MPQSLALLPDSTAARFDDVLPLQVPRPSVLGRDPEPFGSDRFEGLMRRVTVELTHPGRSAAQRHATAAAPAIGLGARGT